MRFKVKPKPYIRFVRRFAIFPVRINNEILWLEKYYIMQKQESRYSGYINLEYITQDKYDEYGPDRLKEMYILDAL